MGRQNFTNKEIKFIEKLMGYKIKSLKKLMKAEFKAQALALTLSTTVKKDEKNNHLAYISLAISVLAIVLVILKFR